METDPVSETYSVVFIKPDDGQSTNPNNSEKIISYIFSLISLVLKIKGGL
jgi:hypothetical protein